MDGGGGSGLLRDSSCSQLSQQSVFADLPSAFATQFAYMLKADQIRISIDIWLKGNTVNYVILDNEN